MGSPRLATFVGSSGVQDGSDVGHELLYPRSTFCMLVEEEEDGEWGEEVNKKSINLATKEKLRATFLVSDEHAIRVVSHDGQMRTLAGVVGVAGFADSSSTCASSPPAVSSALFDGPHGVALLPCPASPNFDADGGGGPAIIVCDINNHR